MRCPPTFGPEFLAWLRETSEAGWSRGEDGYPPGTRWSGGLSAEGLADVEATIGAPLPEDYRLFLATLHSTTRHRRAIRYQGSTPVEVEVPGFYDWTRAVDRGWALAAVTEVVDGLVFDVEHAGLWNDSWGDKPPTREARHARVSELVAAAPPLFPVFAHRFVVAGTRSLVISIMQSDIIVYGSDLRSYLLAELALPGGRADVALGDIPFWDELVS